MPPGHYRVAHWAIYDGFTNQQQGKVEIPDKGQESEFEVQAGKVTFIGRYRAESTSTSWSTATTSQLRVVSKSICKREVVSRFRADYPNIPPNSVTERYPYSGPECHGAVASSPEISLPEGWASVEITLAQKAKNVKMHALNRDINVGMTLAEVNRTKVVEMTAYVKNAENFYLSAVISPKQTEIERLQIDDSPAWRFEVEGQDKTSDKDFTWVITIIDRGSKIEIFDAYTPTAKFPINKKTMRNLAVDLHCKLTTQGDFCSLK